MRDCFISCHVHESGDFGPKNWNLLLNFHNLIFLIYIHCQGIVNIRPHIIRVMFSNIGIKLHFRSQGQIGDLKRDGLLFLGQQASKLWKVLPVVIIRMVRKFYINLVDFFEQLGSAELVGGADLEVQIGVVFDHRCAPILVNSHLRIALVGNEDDLPSFVVFDLVADIQAMFK